MCTDEWINMREIFHFGIPVSYTYNSCDTMNTVILYY